MVYLSYIIALFLVCFGLGLLILLFGKSRRTMVFGVFFMIFSGIILISGTAISADTILFLILGMYALSLVLLFAFRDELKLDQEENLVRSEANE